MAVIYIELSDVKIGRLVEHKDEDYIKIGTGYISVNDVRILPVENGKITVPPGEYHAVDLIKDPVVGDLEATVIDFSGVTKVGRLDVISDAVESVLLPREVNFYCKLLCPNLTHLTYPESVGSFTVQGKLGAKFECPRRIAMVAQYREDNLRSALRVLASGCKSIALGDGQGRTYNKTIDHKGLTVFRDKLRLMRHGFKEIAIL